MEEEILNQENIATKPVTPDMDFSVLDGDYVDPNNLYEISDEELEKLGKHELKWSTETYEEDGETKTRPILIPNDPTEENTRNLAVQRIAELKKLLSDTDYIVLKIAEAETEEEKQALRNDDVYAKKLALRKQWRKDINELEEYLNEENRVD